MWLTYLLTEWAKKWLSPLKMSVQSFPSAFQKAEILNLSFGVLIDLTILHWILKMGINSGENIYILHHKFISKPQFVYTEWTQSPFGLRGCSFHTDECIIKFEEQDC